MRNLARRLIAAERRGSDSADTDGRAAFRACEKLRKALSTLVGARGFETLLARALSVARADAPWLAKLEVSPGGSVVIPETLAKETGESEAARGGTALVTRLLELLATFIGEALTRRLVQQVWPKIPLGDLNCEEKK